MESQELREAYVQRVARTLSPRARQALAKAVAQALTLRRRTLTLLSVAGPDAAALPSRLLRRVQSEIDRLAERHGGMRDPFAGTGIAVLFFADAGDAVRMALQLQRTAAIARLRVGVETVECVVAGAEVDGQMHVTLLGEGADRAAQSFMGATNGSVFVCPSAYTLVRYVVEADTRDCLLAEEFDGDSQLAQVTITPACDGPEASAFAALSGS